LVFKRLFYRAHSIREENNLKGPIAMSESLALKDDNSVVEDAAKAPGVLFEASVGDSPDVLRDKGLILTKEQIKNLKKYEVAGLALPTQLHDVVAYLGYESGAGQGLEASDFQKTFSTIHAHARQWNPLRTDLINVGTKLEIFAGKMEVYGRTMEGIYADIRALGTLEVHGIKTLEDVKRLKLELGDQFPGIDLDANDLETKSEFALYLSKILDLVKEQESEVDDITQRLASFGFELANTVHPAIRLKMKVIENSPLSEQVRQLKDVIDSRDVQIDEKSKEYKKLVSSSLGSLTGGVPGLAGAIYFGVEAEKVRKERNRLLAEQSKDVADMQHKDHVIGSLKSVKLDLQRLDIIVIDADIATQNLTLVWNRLGDYFKQSSQSVDAINDALAVRSFMTNFRLVAEPWKGIKEDARKLLDVFAEADKEFTEEYVGLTNE
jgi:hypothetical protein